MSGSKGILLRSLLGPQLAARQARGLTPLVGTKVFTSLFSVIISVVCIALEGSLTHGRSAPELAWPSCQGWGSGGPDRAFG